MKLTQERLKPAGQQGAWGFSSSFMSSGISFSKTWFVTEHDYQIKQECAAAEPLKRGILGNMWLTVLLNIKFQNQEQRQWKRSSGGLANQRWHHTVLSWSSDSDFELYWTTLIYLHSAADREETLGPEICWWHRRARKINRKETQPGSTRGLPQEGRVDPPAVVTLRETREQPRGPTTHWWIKMNHK